MPPNTPTGISRKAPLYLSAIPELLERILCAARKLLILILFFAANSYAEIISSHLLHVAADDLGLFEFQVIVLCHRRTFYEAGVTGRTKQVELKVLWRERLRSKSLDTLLNRNRLLILVISKELTMYDLQWFHHFFATLGCKGTAFF